MTTTVEAPTRPPAASSARPLLPYEPQSASAARRLVCTTLRAWGLGDLVEAGELVVSELAGNAAKTGCRRKMTVTVERITDRCVRISVRDGSRALPCLIDAGPAAESGRGPALVHHLTGGHWGVSLETFGKTVHADLRTRSPTPAQPLCPGAPGPALCSSRVPGGHHRSDDKEFGMDIEAVDGGGSGGDGGGGGDGHPGTPWTPPSDPPSPDGSAPPGDGGHRK